ncbi:MAG: CoA-acylating methylmalonate-semialdehyde dehydrogenase [Kiritimatiellae bacterium]|nr:CoA-acylating methylmalonate-semialdehyde dehydrogenase [Kiritimatiellia bacterium]
MQKPQELGFWINGRRERSGGQRCFTIMNPSDGTALAHAPRCTREEVGAAIQAAAAAFPAWRDTPVLKRVQPLYRFRELVLAHREELSRSVSLEHGKCLGEAEGEVLKVLEAVEFACGAPSLMAGEALLNASTGHDTTLYREPLGVFAALAPWNFPAMIPMGWMMPMCVATGNTLVLKASSLTPMTALRMAELLSEAGLPPGVVNVITCGREEGELLLLHPGIRGVTFVGSTSAGRKIFSTASANGKRVQVLGEAKNHCLVLNDAPVRRTALSILNATYGCAGERCMALPVVVAQHGIADDLVRTLKELAQGLKIGPGTDPASELGPLVSREHRDAVAAWIAKGVSEGAELALDGRGCRVPGHEDGFYLGPTLFDRVTPEMAIGCAEIFGPVTCVKRVADFEEGLALMNANPYANGSAIFTRNGWHAREFARRTHAGMVGVNVGIPVPIGIFPFAGHKQSFFGDLHALGKDGLRFYTESKCVTTRWFDEEECRREKTDTWDGAAGTR